MYYKLSAYGHWVGYTRPVTEEYIDTVQRMAYEDGIKKAVTTWPKHYWEVPYTTRWYRVNGIVCIGLWRNL